MGDIPASLATPEAKARRKEYLRLFKKMSYQEKRFAEDLIRAQWEDGQYRNRGGDPAVLEALHAQFPGRRFGRMQLQHFRASLGFRLRSTTTDPNRRKFLVTRGHLALINQALELGQQVIVTRSPDGEVKIQAVTRCI